MFKKITLESAINFMKLSVSLCFSWPLPAIATKRQIICLKILRFLTYLNLWMIILPLCLTFQDWKTNNEDSIKSIPIIAGAIQIFMQMVICHQDSIQSLFLEMENQCKLAKGYEKDVLQRYTDRCVKFYGFTSSYFYFVSIVIICSPPLLHDPFPTSAKYPFEVLYQPMRTIIYIQQSYAGIQISSQLCAHNLTTLLLWFSAAKFEVLCNDLRMITSIYDLMQCIKKHHELLRYANKIIDAVRFTVLLTASFSVLAILFCGLTFVSNQPNIIRLQYCMVCFTVLWELFAWCWSADNLLTVSSNVSTAAYESEWHSQSIHLQKNLIPIFFRCQKPVIIRISCVMQTLSLQYLSSYITTVFSYFTTIRMMLVNEE